MKKSQLRQIIKEEIKRVLNEAFIDTSGNLQNFEFNQSYKLPNHLVSNGWEEGDTSDVNADAAKEFGFEWVRIFIRPMEGWDEENLEKVTIQKHGDKFKVDVYIPFGEFNAPEEEMTFNTEKEAFEEAIRVMEELIEN